MRTTQTLWFLFVVFLAAHGAVASDEARRHFEAGNQFRIMEDYASAATEYELSFELKPTKSALFNLANCYKALHRYDKALAAFDRLLTQFDDELGDDMRESAKTDAAALRKLMGELTITANVNGASVRIKNRIIGQIPLEKPVVLPPGTHEVVVVSPEGQELSRSVTIVSGDKKAEYYDFSPALPPPPPATPEEPAVTDSPVDLTAETDKPLEPPPPTRGKLSGMFWVGLGGTVLFGAASTVFWVLAANKKSAYEDQVSTYDLNYDTYPWGELNDKYNELEQTRSQTRLLNGLAVGTTVAAGVMLAGSVIFLIVDLKKDPESPVALYPSVNGVTLSF